MPSRSFARNQYSRTTVWLDSLTITPDPRGDLIEELRRRQDVPAQFPNRMYLYRFVRDRYKKVTREHLDVVPGLYAEYQKHWKEWLKNDDIYKIPTS